MEKDFCVCYQKNTYNNQWYYKCGFNNINSADEWLVVNKIMYDTKYKTTICIVTKAFPNFMQQLQLFSQLVIMPILKKSSI